MSDSSGETKVKSARRKLRLWEEFKDGRSGERFAKLRQRRLSMRDGCCWGEKCLNILGGAFLCVLGFFLIPTPGPGFPLLGLRLALLGTEFPLIARAMDVTELKARERLTELKEWWLSKRQSQSSLVVAKPGGGNGEASFEY